MDFTAIINTIVAGTIVVVINAIAGIMILPVFAKWCYNQALSFIDPDESGSGGNLEFYRSLREDGWTIQEIQQRYKDDT